MNFQKPGMNWPLLQIVIVAALACGQTGSSAQQPIMGGDGVSNHLKARGLMGVFQLPRRPVGVPRSIRALLPHAATVRLLQRLTLSPTDTLVVYDTPDSESSDSFFDDRYPAFLVLRAGHPIGRFAPERQRDDSAGWVFLEAGELHISPEKSGVVLAFRSVGDGSGSLFLVVSPDQQEYRIVLRRTTDQARLRIDAEGILEFWDANEGDECVWCDHHYKVLAYKWDGLHFARKRMATSCRKINPDAITDEPIEAVSQPLNAEYLQAEHSKQDEQRLLRAKLPAGLDGIYRGKLGQTEIVLAIGRARLEHWAACDFRDPTQKVHRRYPILGRYLDQQQAAVELGGGPLSGGVIRLREYRDGKPTGTEWKLSITAEGAVGVRRKVLQQGSGFSRSSTAVSLRRTSPDSGFALIEQDGRN